MTDFTWLDFFVFGIFFLSFIMGLSRGLLKEIISLMSLAIAFIVAIKFTGALTNLLSTTQGALDIIAAISKFIDFNATETLSTITLAISFLLLFAGTYFTGEAVNHYMPAEMMFPGIGSMLFRLLGGAIGLIRGCALNVVFLLLVSLTPISQTEAWTQSHFVPEFQQSVSQVLNLIQPSGFK